MRIACSVRRAQSRPRRAQVPSPTIGILNPLVSIVGAKANFPFSPAITRALPHRGVVLSSQARWSHHHYGVSHFGACGGLTTRILVALSFFRSAISEFES